MIGIGEPTKVRSFRTFKRQVFENVKYYRVPVVALDRSTTKEAVCVVFKKINTGGKPLDALSWSRQCTLHPATSLGRTGMVKMAFWAAKGVG